MIDDPIRPRVVASYRGVQLLDAREHVRIVFTDVPRRGVLVALRFCAGFRQHGSESLVFERAMSPAAIFEAQGVLAEFYGKEIQ